MEEVCLFSPLVRVKRESCRWVARAKTRKSFWFRTCVFVAVLTALSPAHGRPPSAPFHSSLALFRREFDENGPFPLPLSSVSASLLFALAVIVHC